MACLAAAAPPVGISQRQQQQRAWRSAMEAPMDVDDVSRPPSSCGLFGDDEGPRSMDTDMELPAAPSSSAEHHHLHGPSQRSSSSPTCILDLPHGPLLAVLGALGDVRDLAAACLACRAFQLALYGTGVEDGPLPEHAAAAGGAACVHLGSPSAPRIVCTVTSIERLRAACSQRSPIARFVTDLRLCIAEGASRSPSWSERQRIPQVNLYELAVAMPNLRSLASSSSIRFTLVWNGSSGAAAAAAAQAAPAYPAATRPVMSHLAALDVADCMMWDPSSPFTSFKVPARMHEALRDLMPSLRTLRTNSESWGWGFGLLAPQLHTVEAALPRVHMLFEVPTADDDVHEEAATVGPYGGGDVRLVLAPAIAAALKSLQHLTLDMAATSTTNTAPFSGSVLLPPSLRTLHLTVSCNFECVGCATLDMARHPRLRVSVDSTKLAVLGPGSQYVGEEGGRRHRLSLVSRPLGA